MFVWDELKRGVPESVRFCIGDLPMYIFFIPTHLYLKLVVLLGKHIGTLMFVHNCFIYPIQTINSN